MNFTPFKVEFTKNGTIFDPAQVAQVVAAAPGLSDLIVISHGWNNDVADASLLYDNFFKSVDTLLSNPSTPARLTGPLSGRTFGVVRVFWPSKRFAPEDLIPAGGVAAVGGGTGALAKANHTTLLNLLEQLKHDPERLGGTDTDPARVAAMDRAIALVPNLRDDDAKKTYVELLRSILDKSQASRDDGSTEFFTRDPLELFNNLNGPVVAPPPPNPGGAASLQSMLDSAGKAVGGALSRVGQAVSDVVDGAEAAARRIANYATYATMKERAGNVGANGAAEMIRQVLGKNPALKLHLIGHSFGGRLVTAAASQFSTGTAASMSLLQAAYSHNGLGKNYDNRQHDGFFRTVLADRRVAGPIIITHTKNDVAVGIAYPLASRFSHATAAALGDQNDPYGGMGRNGAQHTPEVQVPAGALLRAGSTYAFQAGKVHNLLADEFIMDHGDVTGREVAYAVLSAIVKV